MKFINTRKFTWIICIIGFLLALVSIFFLPSIIPVHFANGIADDYGRKIQIFLFPILQVLITFLTGREKVKYCLTHSKTFLTDIQFNWMIDGVLLLVMFAEIWVIYASLAVIGIVLKQKENTAVSVIGGADGPTSIFIAGKLNGDNFIFMIVVGIILLILAGVIFYKRKH